MRIRKHATSTSHVPGWPQTHVCQLNRCLWDVFPLSASDADPYQEAVEDVEGTSIANNPSPTRKRRQQKKTTMGMLKEEVVTCHKQDGRGWRCKREAKKGSSLCDYHLNQIRSYHWYPKRRSLLSSGKGAPTQKPPPAPARQARTKRAAAVAGFDFYYYSGFGPRWGKTRRVDERGEVGVEEEVIADDDGDDDEVDGEEDYEKRRTRKPLKSRSLMSFF